MEERLDRMEKTLGRLQTEINDTARARAERDGKHNAWWEHQHIWNREIEMRVIALERTAWRFIGIGTTVLFLTNLGMILLIRFLDPR